MKLKANFYWDEKSNNLLKKEGLRNLSKMFKFSRISYKLNSITYKFNPIKKLIEVIN